MVDGTLIIEGDFGPNKFRFEWSGSETEWQQQALAFIGTPASLPNEHKATKAASNLAAKVGQGIWSVTERLTRPPKK